MSSKYFKNFPTVQYGQHKLRNIILKAKIAKDVIMSFDNFYPYTIKEGETPTELAFNYYGSIDYVWLIFAANDILDPYYDWPLSNSNFERFLINKYGSLESTYTVNNSYFYRHEDYSYFMTNTTYNHSTDSEVEGWLPVTNYTYEILINETKRKIKLLDKKRAVDISIELENALRKVNV